MASPKKIYGLIGYPVKHSLSPAMHNAAFKYYGMENECEYRLFEVEPRELNGFLKGENTINGVFSKDILGFNVTIPHKISALIKDTIVRVDNTVLLAGAVNTVKRKEGKLFYRNTDSEGFIKSLQEDLKFHAQNKQVIIIGCGGAGRAVIAGLITKGMDIKKIYAYDSSLEAVESAKKHFYSLTGIIENVQEKLKFVSKEEIPEKIKYCQLLVNASPAGMRDGDGSPIDKNLLHKDLYVYDVVYNRSTELVKTAKEKCGGAANGLGMLLYQGVLAWEFWTGKEAPVKKMREALEKELAKK